MNPFARPATARAASQQGGAASFYSSWFASPRDFTTSGQELQTATISGYQALSIIYACVSAWWRMVGSVPWAVQVRNGQEWDRVDGHPLETLVEYPNQQQTRQRQMAMRAMHLGLAGNTLSKKVYVGVGKREVAELWILNPDACRPRLNARYQLDFWEVVEGASVQDVPATDVVHAAMPNPVDPIWGLPPYKSIELVAAMDRDQVRTNRNNARGGNRPAGVWTSPDALDQSQVDLIKRRVREVFALDSHSNEPLVLTGGATFQRWEATPQEMDYLNSRRFTITEIANAYWLPEILFSGNAPTYDNLYTARRQAWEDAATPVLDIIQESLNLALVPWADRTRVWLHYDTSGIPALKDQLAKRLEAHERAIRNGVPLNRSFVLNDLPVEPVTGGDEPMVAVGLQLLSDVTDPIEADFPPVLNQPSARGGQGGEDGEAVPVAELTLVPVTEGSEPETPATEGV